MNMTPEQFCYWLQGRAELVKAPPSEEEWKSIVEHLSLVFTKVTSPAPGTPTTWIPNPIGLPNYFPSTEDPEKWRPQIYCSNSNDGSQPPSSLVC